MTQQDTTPKNPAERQEALLRQIASLASSVQDLARARSAAPAPLDQQPEPAPAGVRRVQFSYALLGELLGRTADGFTVPRVPVSVGGRDGKATLTINDLKGGSAVTLRARDGTVATLDVTAGQEVRTDIAETTPIDTIVILSTRDGVPLAIAACPSSFSVD